ncbi:MAG: trypsin-like peptidase domain-containing protein [Pseudomonadota bacterium]
METRQKGGLILLDGQDWQVGTLAVLECEPGEHLAAPVGMGFVIEHNGEPLLVTCQHVLNDVKSKKIPVTFFACKDPVYFIAEQVDEFRVSVDDIPVDGLNVDGQVFPPGALPNGLDVAVLRLTGKMRGRVPEGVIPLPVISSGSPRDAKISARFYHCEAKHTVYNVTPEKGKLGERRSDLPSTQVESKEMGFGDSGGAIWDPQRGGVIGIYTSKFEKRPEIGVSFLGLMLNSEVLECVIPGFQLRRADDEFEDYLSRLNRHCRQLGPVERIFRDLDLEEDELHFDEIYRPPKLRFLEKKTAKAESYIHEVSGDIESGTEIANWLRTYTNSIVLGSANRGKSTLLKHLASNAWQAPHKIGLNGPHFPVLLRCAEILEHLSDNLEHTIDGVIQGGNVRSISLPSSFECPNFSIVQWCRRSRSRALVLIDGFDEASEESRITLKKQFATWAKQKKHSVIGRVVVASRPLRQLNWPKLKENFEYFELTELDHANAQTLAATFLGENAEHFLGRYRIHRRGMSTYSPGLLLLACAAYTPNAEQVSLSVSYTLSRAVSELLRNVERFYRRDGPSLSEEARIVLQWKADNQIRDVLSAIALTTYAGQRTDDGLDLLQLRRNLKAIHKGNVLPRDDILTNQVIEELGVATGLFAYDEKSASVIWGHLDFRDYLAGQFLSEQYIQKEKMPRTHLSTWAVSEGMNIIVFFLMQMMTYKQDVKALLRKMLSQEGVIESQRILFLVECIKNGIKIENTYREQIYAWLDKEVPRSKDIRNPKAIRRISCADLFRRAGLNPLEVFASLAEDLAAQDKIIGFALDRGVSETFAASSLGILSEVGQLNRFFEHWDPSAKSRKQRSSADVASLLSTLKSYGQPIQIDIHQIPEAARHDYLVACERNQAALAYTNSARDPEVSDRISALIDYAEESLSYDPDWKAFLTWLEGEYPQQASHGGRFSQFLQSRRYQQ